ncbi:MAG: FHA domain-containing protein [Myxococcota bacterium]
MARHRLRFLLQEFDLPAAEVDIGRGPECHVTVEDPMVSRRHARIRVRGEDVDIQDLGSRNGVRINGRQIQGAAPLQHGDRIRLGTQELVFIVADARETSTRTTGYLSVCGSCGKPYPEQSAACPHCGVSSRDDDTLSGVALEPRQTFTFQLLGQVIERAIQSGRAQEADRVMRRAAQELEERLGHGDRLDGGQLGTMARYAVDLAELCKDPSWVRWLFDLHRRQGALPAAAVVDRLEASGVPGVAEEAGTFVHWVREQATKGPAGDPALLRRLDSLARLRR